MCLGEATGLKRQDVNLTDGVLTITVAKFDRARLVPLHPSTTAALTSYTHCRDRLPPTPRTAAFFLSPAGTGYADIGIMRTTRGGSAPRAA